jgi:hypothetical protein
MSIFWGGTLPGKPRFARHKKREDEDEVRGTFSVSTRGIWLTNAPWRIWFCYHPTNSPHHLQLCSICDPAH